MGDRAFQEALEMGRSAEMLVADELRRRGWYVVPSYDYTGSDGNKAPRMSGGSASFVVPDLDVCSGGRRVWVEVKAKTEATLYRKGGTWEHGVDARLWRQYLRVQAESGCAVFLCVVELNTNTALVASLDRLTDCARRGTGRGSFMVYFPRSQFSKFEIK